MMTNWIDVTLIILSLLSVGLGVYRGLLSEFFALLVWAAAIGLSLMFSSDLSAALAAWIEAENLRIIAAFSGIFMATFLLGLLLRYLLSWMLSVSGLGLSNRLAGGCFGAARAYLMLAVLLLLAGYTSLVESEDWESAQIPPLFTKTTDFFHSFVPALKSELSDLAEFPETLNLDDYLPEGLWPNREEEG